MIFQTRPHGDQRNIDSARLCCAAMDDAGFMLEPTQSCLILNDETRLLQAHISLGDARGIFEWSRRFIPTLGQDFADLGAFRPAHYDVICLRLPKSKTERDMYFAMALHCLAPHGILYVFGANDEGIKSAASALGSHFGAVSQLANAKRCRVYMGTAPNPQHSNAWDLPCLYADLSQHIPAANNILFYPGNFAAGRLDDGSALLLETLPNLATVRTALDYGCGAGILPLALQQHKPDITWYCLDIDRLALLATAHNTQHMQPAPHLIWNREIPAQMPSVDLIISNPPVHAGKADDYSIVQNLIHDAPRHLHATGQLAMVVHPHAPVEDLLKHAFKRVERAGRSKGYCVWHAAAPQR